MKFMMAYYGGDKPLSKEEGMAQMEKWKTWISGLGDKVINPGTPLPQSKIVTQQGVREDDNPKAMNGFAIVTADSLEEALEIAKSDPFLETKGEIRVSQMMEMK